MKLPVLPVPTFKVLVGNGQSLHAEGLIQNLQITIQGTVLTLNAYLLPVMGADVILGTSWLATLGPHIADYQNLSIQFVLENQLVTLQGEHTMKPHSTSVHQLHRLCSTKSIDCCYTLSITELPFPQTSGDMISTPSANFNSVQLELPADMPVELQKLLYQYQGVFAVPSGLPPSRVFDHAIPLMPEAAPIKIKPYRYPHS